MVRQEFKIENYWRVIVYYDVDYSFFETINKELLDSGFSEEPLSELWYTMKVEKAKAVTCSNLKKHLSIVLFNTHDSKLDYLNSLVHEAEHIKEAMLEAYEVENKGEAPAYTIAHLVERMWKVFSTVVN